MLHGHGERRGGLVLPDLVHALRGAVIELAHLHLARRHVLASGDGVVEQLASAVGEAGAVPVPLPLLPRLLLREDALAARDRLGNAARLQVPHRVVFHDAVEVAAVAIHLHVQLAHDDHSVHGLLPEQQVQLDVGRYVEEVRWELARVVPDRRPRLTTKVGRIHPVELRDQLVVLGGVIRRETMVQDLLPVPERLEAVGTLRRAQVHDLEVVVQDQRAADGDAREGGGRGEPLAVAEAALDAEDR
mmetsp:Transcript_70430/g.204238  ORF Transcript_70430/g.204238 Transcript_70430/m.204238 type:complete len:245 (+) Transcript_70430:303-1037(+)